MGSLNIVSGLPSKTGAVVMRTFLYNLLMTR